MPNPGVSYQQYLDQLAGTAPEEPEEPTPSYQQHLDALAGVKEDPVVPVAADQVAQNQQYASAEPPAVAADRAEVGRIPQLQLDVYPNTWDAVLDAHESRGRSFGGLRKNETLRKATIKLAEGYALGTLKNRGLVLPDGSYAPGLRKETVGALVNAYRYMLVGAYAPMAASEEPQIKSNGGQALMAYLQQKGLDKLAGMDPRSPEAFQLQQTVARAKQYQSLFEAKDPAALRALCQPDDLIDIVHPAGVAPAE